MTDAMPPLRTDLQSLVNEEQMLTANARDRLGSFVEVALNALGTLNTFVVSIEEDHFLAAASQLAIQKSITLAFLSYVRSHFAQAEFNTRQAIEFSSLCAYLMAHPEEDATGSGEAFKPPKAMSTKAYKWMDQEHSELSKMLHELKSQVNDTSAHASVYLTAFTFDWQASKGDRFQGSFFDTVDPNMTRMALISLARLVIIIVQTLRLTAEKYGGFKVREGIEDELRALERDVHAHREALGEALKLAQSATEQPETQGG